MRRCVLALIIVSSGFAGRLHAQQQPESNAGIFMKELREIAGEILRSAPLHAGDTVSLRIERDEAAPIAEQAFAETLLSNRIAVFRDTMAASKYEFTVASKELNVRYEKSFKDGVFGASRCGRTISASCSAIIVHRSSREVLYSGTVSRTCSDTVDVGMIGSLEDEAMKFTHGDVPSETFLDRFVEPFVIVGATGIAIYLLFHIRS